MPDRLTRTTSAIIYSTREQSLASGQIVLSFLLLLLLCGVVRPQRLPLKVYTASDGMASSVIGNIVRDSDGFLWFSARGGLTRYDGNEFLTVRFTDTESSPLVHGFLESRDGRYLWISTDNALYRVRRSAPEDVKPTHMMGRPGERVLAAMNVTRGGFWKLYETRDGRLITGSADGISEAVDLDADRVEFRRISHSKTALLERRTGVRAFVETADGSLWAAADVGIVRRLANGRWITYEIPSVVAVGNEAFSIFPDQHGRIWVSYRSGVFALKPETPEQLSSLEDLSVLKPPVRNAPVGVSGSIDLPDNDGELIKLDFTDRKDPRSAGQEMSVYVQEIFRSGEGTIWVPTEGGLYSFRGENYGRIRDANHLPGPATAIAETPNGDLWFGTLVGAIKYVRRGLTSYSADSGLPHPSTSSIGEYAGSTVASHGLWQMSVLGQEQIDTRQINLPPNARSLWTSFPIVPDKTGGLWALTNGGLYHLPAKRSLAELTGQKPKLVRSPLPNLADKAFYRAFNDSRGRIWFSAIDIKSQRRYLFRNDPRTHEWTDLSTTEGFPLNKTISSLTEDRAGDIWFGYYNLPGLLKLSGGRFTEYGAEVGLPPGSVLALLTDSKGRIWLGSNEGGIARIEDPTSAEFKVVRHTEDNGLSSNNVRCLVEDNNGRIYAGTVRGVTRIDTAERLSIISTEDGLAADFVHSAYRDEQGAVWFGTSNGVSHLEPSVEKVIEAPPVFITTLQIAGVAYGLSGLGQQSASGIEVGPSENNLQVAFTAVGNALRFQYKLDGGAESDWRMANADRSVDFANLAPGSYSFLVRAVTRDGSVSQQPAVVSFRIYPPIWQRWWFIAPALLTLAAVVFWLDRYRALKARQVNEALTGQLEAERALRSSREERFRELERVRARIATDLHDDIGSSLTQIAVLSEVARGAASQLQAEQLARPLDRIKTVSKELVDVMSDVVWAINPHKDHLVDLVQRMRRFGSDIFSGRGIAFEFTTPQAEEDLQLGANIRRELFAIFKESANNAVKYSECSRVRCEFQIDNERLILTIADNGVGFDTERVLSDAFKPEVGETD